MGGSSCPLAKRVALFAVGTNAVVAAIAEGVAWARNSLSEGPMPAGPLSGLKFVDMAGLGPAPCPTRMLADLGATGVCIESPEQRLAFPGPEFDITRRGRSSMHLGTGTAV
ncbi:MAG: hypothetical protein CK552_05895 [Actinobacteria bacterium]|nr:MAG: hypothetical protein CK552_05895 [Actinomycetota bacterium]